MALGQEREHLLNLNDLFGGTAQKTEQRLAEWLPQDSQPAKHRDALLQVRIAPPWQGVGERGKITVAGEVRRKGLRRRSNACARGAPFHALIGRQPEEHDCMRPNSKPSVVALPIPAERLTSIEDLGEHIWAQ
jgi:hypothetical protein